MAGFFIKHSYRDVKRKKFHFCLSFCSVFIVVWCSLIINTIIEKGPIIFLRLSENSIGQFDGILYPSKYGNEESNQNGYFLDYTKVMNVTNNKFNLSPRKNFTGVDIGSNYGALRTKYDEQYLSEYESKFVQTEDGNQKLQPYNWMYSGAA